MSKIRGRLKGGHVMYANPVHLKRLRKQRLMKRCVLPRRAWSQNGRVMYVNLVDLIHSRKQRLMKNSAVSLPCAGGAN
jgi:hypothetical protein